MTKQSFMSQKLQIASSAGWRIRNDERETVIASLVIFFDETKQSFNKPYIIQKTHLCKKR